jgi:hypothetical protein
MVYMFASVRGRGLTVTASRSRLHLRRLMLDEMRDNHHLGESTSP